ncbi:MAG: hypothetical protein Q8N30_04085 [Methylococcales bacterium]|nr:hypothetical protein [Methylococcales bacterium]
MSARVAAEALFNYDNDLFTEITGVFAGRVANEVPYEDRVNLIKAAINTWTLSMVAHAAGLSEFQVLVALAKYHLNLGSSSATEVQRALDS